MDFPILIADGPTVQGVGALSEVADASPLHMLPFEEAMSRRWGVDAHFVCYRSETEDGPFEQQDQFRLRKTVEAELKEHGGRVRCWGFVGDYDLNENVSTEVLKAHGWQGGSKLPKIPWTQTQLDKFLGGLHELSQSLKAKDLGLSFAYTTRHGARFVHVYDAPISTPEHEAAVMGMLQVYETLGITLDRRCKDWTRVFRAPCVRRAGENTWDNPFYRRWLWRDTTKVSAIPRASISRRTDYAPAAPYGGDRPTPEQALELLEDISNGRKTEEFQQLRSLMKRHGLDKVYEVLTQRALKLPEGGRDTALTSLVGQLICFSFEKEWSTPELIYAVFLPIAEQLEPDDDTPDWTLKLWSLVCRMWTREESKVAAEVKQRAQVREEQQNTLVGLLERVRRIYPGNPELNANDDRALVELQRRGLIKCGSAIYILGPDGYYSRQPIDAAVLPGTIADMGMEFLMPIEAPNKEGELKPLDSRQLLRAYGRSVTTIVGQPGITGSYVDSGRLHVPLFEWVPHEPVHDEQVHTWLQKMGGTQWEAIAKWIAYAQDMRRPICALAILGRKGVGKGMLARGLQELIEGAPVPATGADLIENFSPAMSRSPFIVVDEGLPTGKGVRDISDIFRRTVAGEPLWINPGKNLPHIEVNVPFRILLTANNSEILHGLVGDRTLTPEDRAALAERLKCVNVLSSDQASMWLRTQGGRDFTSGWVAGDGLPSEYRVAKHFRWLYENREDLFGPPSSERFLMTGDLKGGAVESMRVLSGVTPEVAKICIKMLGQRQLSPDIGQGISFHKGQVLISAGAIVDYYRSSNAFDRQVTITEATVNKALDNLISGKLRKRVTTRKGNQRQLTWRVLDLQLLFDYAEDNGLPSEAVEKLLHEQQK